MPHPLSIPRVITCAAVLLSAVALSGCGGSGSLTQAADTSTESVPTTTATPAPVTTQTRSALPGTGKPQVTIGDKNYTEQFVLGELYYLALQGQGFSVQLNKNIGPTEVTLQALQTGQLGMYPEYLDTWNSSVAGYKRNFTTEHSAYEAGQRWALEHGMQLLDPTPFSDTNAIGVTVGYADHNRLRTIADLGKVAQQLTLGAPPQFEQDPGGLPALEQNYTFEPASFKALEIGQQYSALDSGGVQAADVSTTDGELTTGNYTLLRDPMKVFGVGNVVPVVSAQVLDAEGPAFEDTINRVSALLTLPTIRALNAAVDIAGEDPAKVAQRFLVDHGILPIAGSG